MNQRGKYFRDKGMAFLAATFLTLAAGHTVLAQDGEGPGTRGHRMFRGLHGVLRSLDLTEDQKASVKAAFQDEKPALKDLHQQMKADHEALKQAADASSPDPAGVGNAFLRVRADRQAIRAEMEKIHAKIGALLTPDQKARFEGAIDAMKAMHGMHGQGRGAQ